MEGAKTKKETPQECLFCQKRLRTARLLENHINKHTRERFSFCDKSVTTFKRPGNLKTRHKAAHHMAPKRKPARLRDKRFECLFCDFKFSINRDLESHMNTHTHERPYECLECDAAYSNPGTLYVHKKAHKLKPKAKKGQRQIRATKRNTLRGRKPRRNQSNNESRYSDAKTNIEEEKDTDNLFVSVKLETEEERQVNAQKVQMRSNPPLVKSQEMKLEEPSQLPKPSTFKKHLKSGIRRGRRIRTMKLDKRKVDRLGENCIAKSRPGSEKESKYNGNICTPQSDMAAHFLQFQYSLPFNSHFMMPNVFSHKNDNSSRKWDPSFFLHMNRYNPKDSCFSNTHAETTLPNQNKTKNKCASSKNFQLNKRGRPRKNSNEEENFATSTSIPPAELKTDIPNEIEKVGGGYVKCPYCSKIFYNCNLTAHLLTHTGEKPFACAFCEFQFRQKSHMIKHIVRYHRYGCNIQKPGSKRPPPKYTQDLPIVTGKKDNFSCPYCGTLSKNALLMEQHLLRDHNDKLKLKK